MYMGILLEFEFDISRWRVKPPHFMGYNRHLFKKIMQKRIFCNAIHAHYDSVVMVQIKFNASSSFISDTMHTSTFMLCCNCILTLQGASTNFTGSYYSTVY